MAAKSNGKRVALVVLIVAVLGGGGFWALRGRSSSSGLLGRGSAPKRTSIFAGDPGEEKKGTTGAIEGVVESSRGGPIAGAIVAVTKARGPETPPFQMSRPAGTTVTGADGRFRFENLAAAEYGLTAMAAGFTPGERSPVKVTGTGADTVTLVLSAGGLTLSGHVYDAGGGVVPGALIRASSFSGNGRIPRFYQVTTDDAGLYKLTLEKGFYGLTAEAEGYAPIRDGVTIGRDETRDLRLMPAARLYGRVVERANKQPVPDAEVWVVSERRFDQLPPRDVKTDANGNFAFNDLPSGTFGVAARRGRLVGYSKMTAVSAMQTVTDVEVETDPGLVVRGRVVDAQDQGVKEVRLALNKRDPPFDRGTWANSEPDGSFALEGVLPGQYDVWTNKEGFAQARKEIAVAAKDVDGIVLKLTQGAVLSGTVVTSQGSPVAGAQVNAEMIVKMDGGGGRMFTGRGDKTDAEGKFEIKDMEPCQINVRAKHADHGSGAADSFNIAAGEKKAVRIVLGTGASVAGKVHYEDGTPAAGLQVYGSQRTPGNSRSESDVTAADGTFKIGGLAAGGVDLSVRRDNASMPKNTVVTLAEGEQKTGVELEISKASLKISGQVVGPDGAPIVGATLSAGPERDGRAMRLGQRGRAFLSGEGGSFVIEELPKGTYTVWAFHSSHPDAEVKGVEAGATGIRLQMPVEASVAGAVVGTDGQPVADYTIALLPGPADKESPNDRNRRLSMGAFDNPVRRVHDPAGAFAFDRLKGGAPYELKVTTNDGRSGSSVVNLQPGEKKTGVRVALASGVRIVGRIVDLESGKPLAEASVTAMAMGNPGRPTPAKTAADGTFKLENIVSDQPLRVSAALEGYVADGRELDSPKGKTEIDVGTIKLMTGDWEAKFAPGQRGFPGFGVSNREGHPVVSNIQKGTPAEKAGLQAGDILLAVDGRDARELGPGAIRYLVAGKPGSSFSVELQAKDADKPRKVTLTRVDPETMNR